jgi:preprotein translocase subunit SecG
MILASFIHIAISTVFVLVCVLLILVILLQKGRGGGLSGAFGGGGGGYSAFGAKTGDVFTWVTVALTFLFVLTAMVGNWLYVPEAPKVPPAGTVSPAPGGGQPAPQDSGSTNTDSGSPDRDADGG